MSNFCKRFHNGIGTISKARNSKTPSIPCGALAKQSLSIQNSARWVLPATSTKIFFSDEAISSGVLRALINAKQFLIHIDFRGGPRQFLVPGLLVLQTNH